MDDALEEPQSRPKHGDEDEEHSSGDEDGGLDWTKLAKSAAARPVIPKRGEKDFEPAHGGGSGLQLHVLDRARGAMWDALRAERAISSKSVSYGIWYPSVARVHVTSVRGVHFTSMGHSVARTPPIPENTEPNQAPTAKSAKRLELLPEEAIYLIERGALFCYKSISDVPVQLDGAVLNPERTSPGAPMTVQQAYAEMVGCEDMTLERYQVYAYLKRLGFVLTRATAPTPEYPVAPLSPAPAASRPLTLWQRIVALFSPIVQILKAMTSRLQRTPWQPLRLHGLTSNGDIFRALRFIPCGHSVPLHKPPIPDGRVPQSASSPALSTSQLATSPYKVFFHMYKPSTPFRKTSPPVPDFAVVVVNARTTPMPSLYELTSIFQMLPEMPPPPPRKRGVQARSKKPIDATVPGASAPQTAHPSKIAQPPQNFNFLRRLLSCLPFTAHRATSTSPGLPAPHKPNPFLHLKSGAKAVVVAAVDSGNISFFKFGEGVFPDWPMA